MSANKGIMIETRHYDPRNQLDQIRQDFTAWMILLFLLLFTIFLIQIRDTAFDFVSTFTTMLKWYVTEKLNWITRRHILCNFTLCHTFDFLSEKGLYLEL